MGEKGKIENMKKTDSSKLVDLLKNYYRGALSKAIASELIVELNRRIEESKQAMELYQTLIDSLNNLSNKNSDDIQEDKKQNNLQTKVEADGQR